MGRKAKYTKEQKIQACKDYISGRKSAKQIAYELNSNVKRLAARIFEWVHSYQKNGKSIFDDKPTNQKYDSKQKKEIVKEYLNGHTTTYDLAINYRIPSQSTVLTWIKKYNNGEELKDYDPKSEVYSMKSRKVTVEEKQEIVNYVIANNNDYKGAADKYTVPYYQVFNWVKKYKVTGELSLSDKRGRPSKNKPLEELTEVELLKIELEKQKAINERLVLANEILKKNIQIKEKLQRDSRK